MRDSTSRPRFIAFRRWRETWNIRAYEEEKLRRCRERERERGKLESDPAAGVRFRFVWRSCSALFWCEGCGIGRAAAAGWGYGKRTIGGGDIRIGSSFLETEPPATLWRMVTRDRVVVLHGNHSISSLHTCDFVYRIDDLNLRVRLF